MIFCDLSIAGEAVWSGVPCLNGVDISTGRHLGFSGELFFLDTMGSSDPSYAELSTRFPLLYAPADGSGTVQVPLQDLPSQQLLVILGGQNCELSVYEKDVSQAQAATDYLSVVAPLVLAITEVGTAIASGGTAWLWSIVNGTILTGQGTPTVTFQPASGGRVVLTVAATLTSGGNATAEAEVTAYNPGSFTISAPEYVWAGQFGVPVSAVGGDAPMAWTVSGSGIKLIGSSTQPSTTVDIGRAGLGAVVALSVGGSAVSSWTFKVVPYTSAIAYTTPSLAPGDYHDFVLPLGWQYQILSLQTDFPACVRVYETAGARAIDAFRPVNADPDVNPTDHAAIVLEATTAIGYLSWNPLPFQPTGTNGDTPRSKSAYLRVYNTGLTTTAITLTMVRTELQVSGTF